MQKLYIIKIGGNIIDDKIAMDAFLEKFASITEPKILVHGGGKIATELAEKLGIPQQLINGRRITDKETLNVTTMVYAGLINKKTVAQLQHLKCNAIGLCGADANIITTTKRQHPTIDYGFVGDITKESINETALEILLQHNFTLVLNAITHNGEGQLLNTNADTIAASLAIALCRKYKVSLSFCLEKNGVLSNENNNDSYLPTLNKATYHQLKNEAIINKGMIPKLDNAFDALEAGVQEVKICHAAHILKNQIGTILI
jgi:acetylglutamate kinase